MTNAVIQRGTPREPRNVQADPAWLDDRINKLKAKRKSLKARVDAVVDELAVRREQRESLD